MCPLNHLDTGSIGTQTLDVIRNSPEDFSVDVLAAGSSADQVMKQIVEFKPQVVVMAQPKAALATSPVSVAGTRHSGQRTWRPCAERMAASAHSRCTRDAGHQICTRNGGTACAVPSAGTA